MPEEATTPSTNTTTTRSPTTPEETTGRFSLQMGATIVALIGFAILVVMLMVNARDATDVEWNRRVYLLGGVEAILFTAVGWLFGREVHRGEANSAKASAEKATKEASAAKDEAKAKGEEAAVERTKGRAMKATLRAQDESAAKGAGGGAEETALGGGAPAARSTHATLRALAEELWPD